MPQAGIRQLLWLCRISLQRRLGCSEKCIGYYLQNCENQIVRFKGPLPAFYWHSNMQSPWGHNLFAEILCSIDRVHVQKVYFTYNRDFSSAHSDPKFVPMHVRGNGVRERQACAHGYLVTSVPGGRTPMCSRQFVVKKVPTAHSCSDLCRGAAWRG